MEKQNDYMVRGTAGNGQVRAFVATTRDMAEYARKVHGTTPVATAALGRLLTAGVMMGTMMKGDQDEITVRIDGDGPIRMVLVTADSHGTARGCVGNPDVLLPFKENGHLDVGGAVGKGSLKVIRDTGLKEPYVGEVNLVSGEIAEDLTYYFAASEQVPSAVSLGVLVDTDTTVRRAGGMILQMMPDASDEIIDDLENTLKKLPSMTELLEAGKTPEDIFREVLGRWQPEILETVPLSYRCSCSRERVERALISISAKDLRELIEENKTIEVACQFCDKKYSFTVDDLKELGRRKLTGRVNVVDKN
jgi:molecular chaperone Hsp33